MSAETNTLRRQTVAGLPLTVEHENLYVDALRRLARNRAAVLGGVVILVLISLAVLAPVIAPYPFEKQTLVDNNKVPPWLTVLFPNMATYARTSSAYLLGADSVGRDIFSRLMYGARVSLAIAFIGPLISMLLGVAFGGISGYFGGRIDNIMMRAVDVLFAFPALLFIILLMAVFRSTLGSGSQPGTVTYFLGRIDAALGGMFFIVVGISLTAWQNMARLTRGQVLSVREKEFVEATRALGANDRRIMLRHILPNIIGTLIVAETLAIPGYIAIEAFLSFIGLGVNPPMPSWGSMIAEGAQTVRTYPNQAIFPALALALTMFAFNFLGDGLRDAFDPRLRGK